MKNWMGQDIQVGDVVYNARRDGNSTTLRLGRVIGETPKGVRVAWCVVPSRSVWDRESQSYHEPEFSWSVLVDGGGWGGISRGTNNVDTLIKVQDCEAAAAVPPLDTLV